MLQNGPSECENIGQIKEQNDWIKGSDRV